MRQEYKKQNSPRMQSAINRVLTHVYSVLTISRFERYRIVYYPFSSSDIGVSILMLAYGADKYDVLNKLCPGAQTSIVTFARGDIRHRSRISLAELLAMIAVAIVAVILMLSPE